MAQRVVEAFRAHPATETEVKVIRVLLANSGTTSTALSNRIGWSGQSWHVHFGTMCKTREAWLWPAVTSELRDKQVWSGILANYDKATSGWTMKDDVAGAFAALGLAPARSPV